MMRREAGLGRRSLVEVGRLPYEALRPSPTLPKRFPRVAYASSGGGYLWHLQPTISMLEQLTPENSVVDGGVETVAHRRDAAEIEWTIDAHQHADCDVQAARCQGRCSINGDGHCAAESATARAAAERG